MVTFIKTGLLLRSRMYQVFVNVLVEMVREYFLTILHQSGVNQVENHGDIQMGSNQWTLTKLLSELVPVVEGNKPQGCRMAHKD